MKRVRSAKLAAVLVLWASSSAVFACGFIESAGNVATFRQEAVASKFVVFGTLKNPRQGPDSSGQTDLVIASVLKSDPVLAGRKVIQLPRYIPLDPGKEPNCMLVFGDVVKGAPDAYR